MLAERFPTIIKKEFNKEIVISALVPLKNDGSNKIQWYEARNLFDFNNVSWSDVKETLERYKNVKKISATRLQIMHLLCVFFQVTFVHCQYDMFKIKSDAGFMSSLFAAASFD